METKCQEGKMDNICKKIGFENYNSVGSKGLAGGLVLMWTADLSLEILWTDERVICGEITSDEGLGKWRAYFCHGTPYAREKLDFWSFLESDINNWNGPWIVIGDLNEIMNEGEKSGGRSFWKRKPFMRNFINAVNDMDIGFIGKKFTWDNRSYGQGLIKERLDRVISDKEWMLHFQEA